MVGRTTELKRILSVFETITATGRGRLVMLSGEPGVGKTRLAQEVLAHATTLGARTSIGRCFEQYTGVPFFPFTEALTLALAGPSVLLGRSGLERWPELAGVLGDADSGESVQHAHRTQLRVFRAITTFLAEVAETTPLVLFLDDLHWADATSLSLLLYLGRHIASSRILLLGAYRDVDVDRDNGLDEMLRELRRERLLDEVRVRPLGPDGTAGLIRQQFATDIMSDQFVALVHVRAAGNPFFTEELLKALAEEGGVVHGQALCGPEAVARLEVPRSIRSMVSHRVSRLAPETQELLCLGSAIGQEFELQLLVAVSGQTETAVLDQLDPALAAGLLKEPRGGGHDRYAFVHALGQQALYAGLASSRRRQLHRAIGDALERLLPTRPVASAGLARHFLA
jgi:predicted ATPase